MDAHFKPFQPLFVLDPRLLLTFIYIVPNEDYHSLFEQIPPYLSTTWLSHKAIMMSRLNANEVKVFMSSRTIVYLILLLFYRPVNGLPYSTTLEGCNYKLAWIANSE